MIILMGVAGAGKSMQGRLFADERGFAWISTGELLRVLVTGARRHQMLEGKLLSDDEMINILDKVFDLIDLSKEFVLDGFPRTRTQFEWLLEQVENGRFSLTAVFNLTATQEVVRKRLSERGRLDDTTEAINRRFAEYTTETLPILNLFREHKFAVYDINADQAPKGVHDDMVRLIDGADERADES